MSRPLRVDYCENSAQTVNCLYLFVLSRGYTAKISNTKKNKMFIEIEFFGNAGEEKTITAVRGFLIPINGKN